MTDAFAKSEALLNSPLQRLSSRLHQFCMAHGLPRIHGCVWDRHCRWTGAPRRADLTWGRHSVWVDLRPLPRFGHDTREKR